MKARLIYIFLLTIFLLTTCEIYLGNIPVVKAPLNIEMVRVSAGSFTMGSIDPADSNAQPHHNVTLTQGFYIGKYQVTQEQWFAVMGNNPSHFRTESGYPLAAGESALRRPVECVSWYDVIVFCNRLSIRNNLSPVYEMESVDIPGQWTTDTTRWGAVPEGFVDSRWDAVRMLPGSTGYRLPTEAQWEYAAKGGNGSPGNFIYSGSNDHYEVAWTWENSGNRTHEVGKKAANGLGIYDMSGNVWEWCWNWYEDYSAEHKYDPMGLPSGSDRMNRGGVWSGSAEFARSVLRSDWRHPNYRDYGVGFRLLRP